MASVLAEALNSQNPTGGLHAEMSACMLSLGRRLEMETLVKMVRTAAESQVCKSGYACSARA